MVKWAYLALLALGLFGCAGLARNVSFAALREGMSSAEVEQLWGKPTQIQEYEDDSGSSVRWEYRRSRVGEQGYWSFEPEIAGNGYTTTRLERRGIPYSQAYLAAWATLVDGRLVRWQVNPPPANP